jgi:hypothetical protein
MVKRAWILLLILFAVVGFAGSAGAELVKIGTVTINSKAGSPQGPGGMPTAPTPPGGGGPVEYSLIYEDDQRLIWLDYSNSRGSWFSQLDWVGGLNAPETLTYKLSPGVRVSWEGEWRLPKTVDGGRTHGYDGTTTAGFNITTSELGHLYYVSLGNLGYYDTEGNQGAGWYPDSKWGLQNTGPFENLKVFHYWSGTEYSLLKTHAWAFNTAFGEQSNVSFKGSYPYMGIAVRPGTVVVSDKD